MYEKATCRKISPNGSSTVVLNRNRKMAIHNVYTKLSDSEREFVDAVINAAFRIRAEKYPTLYLDGGDAAEHIAESLAGWVMVSNTKM